MAPLKDPRLAWSIAVAALALWLTSAPVAVWGQVAATAAQTVDISNDDASQQIIVDQSLSDSTSTSSSTSLSDTDNPVCPPPPAIAQAPAPAASGASTFHLCGADSAAAAAIEQLIAGRSFSARLSARGDGCADLSIQPTSAGPSSGSATSNLSVALGGGQNLSIQIVSGNGATHVSIGASR